MSLQAIVFPGQGSQRPGMGVDFSQEFSVSNKVFSLAEKILGFDVKALCANDDPRLNQTEFTQPCILTAEIAMIEALKKHYHVRGDIFGGHSLGEYSALVAADAIPLDCALRLVKERGRLMQDKAPLDVGAMIAVIMPTLPHFELEKTAKEFDVDFANDNSVDQLVLSGEKNKIASIGEYLSKQFAEKGIRVIPLNVSAPFHSRFMKAAEEEFAHFLCREKHHFNAANAVKVVSNYTGTFYKNSLESLVDGLTRQMSGQVKWRENMEAIKAHAASIFEVGPHRPLTGFFKSLGISVSSIMDMRTLKRLFPNGPIAQESLGSEPGSTRSIPAELMNLSPASGGFSIAGVQNV